MKSLLRGNLVDLPTNASLNYFWCSGFMLSGFLGLQLLSGVILSLLYVGDTNLSFSCVLGLTKDEFFPWVVRYSHIWGVSVMFTVLAAHIGRGLYYSSYTKISVWNMGFILYLLMMIEAFLGYILPWHQMSYWAATVLTSMIQSVPFVGKKLYMFMVGGFGVTKVTLMRVFAAHIILAFVIVFLAILHLFYLHETGSKNPLFFQKGYSDFVLFHSFYSKKDLFCLVVLLTLCCFLVQIGPDTVLDAEAYLIADPLSTPTTIKPEWYFLFYYAMLRSVSSKIGGLMLVVVFLFLLWVPTKKYASCYFIFRQMIFWVMCSQLFVLSYLGSCAPEEPFVFISQVSSFISVFCLFIFKGFWSY